MPALGLAAACAAACNDARAAAPEGADPDQPASADGGPTASPSPENSAEQAIQSDPSGPGCEGPAGGDHGLVAGRAGTLCAGARSVSAVDGLLVVGRVGLNGGAQVGVVGLIPLQQGWPRLLMATGELGAGQLGRLETSLSGAVGIVRLPDRDRTAGLLQLGAAADRPAGAHVEGGALRRAFNQRVGLHLGVSGWTGAGQPLGTLIELSRGGAIVLEGAADLRLTEHLNFTIEALAPAFVLNEAADTARMAAIPYGLRLAGDQLRLDLGFIKGTGAAAGLDALRLGFPLISLTAQRGGPLLTGPRGLPNRPPP